ncbi:MAG: carbon-nitrogen hydrolase family protein [Flavobacteriales bacterium]|nr:carbon-nitrogen hydrolase family protein [Flavobacteriales bacterium]MCB9448478.1 carbon-nitrogen hydrolase family protein [Flavobacteriales bacterium]
MANLRVGIIQHSPVFLDLEKSMQKAEQLLADAAASGVRMAVFGECWLSGYPAWLDVCPDVALWDSDPAKEVFYRLHESSIVVPGPETERLGALAKQHEMVVVMGVNEKVKEGPGNGTLYNSLLTFDANGKLVNHHRKLMPTYTERMVYGQGDAVGLKSVDTAVGRVSSLICWEHWMPMNRQVLHEDGELMHVAVWPNVHEMLQVASRSYAFEGRCFVLAAGLTMHASDMPPELTLPEHLASQPDAWVLRGGSAIIGPDGFYVHEPVFDKETIVMADIDPKAAVKERMTLDVTGHYYRDDIFKWSVNRKRREE